MSDFDKYPGQNCRCGNDPNCTSCNSGAEAERQHLEELERKQHEAEIAAMMGDE